MIDVYKGDGGYEEIPPGKASTWHHGWFCSLLGSISCRANYFQLVDAVHFDVHSAMAVLFPCYKYTMKKAVDGVKNGMGESFREILQRSDEKNKFFYAVYGATTDDSISELMREETDRVDRIESKPPSEKKRKRRSSSKPPSKKKRKRPSSPRGSDVESSKKPRSQQDREVRWDERYQQAADFYQEHGHLQVPKNDGVDQHKQLSTWIKTQRYQFSLLEVDSNGDKIPNCRMTKERIDKLKIIPGLLDYFKQDLEEIWEERYQEAADFYQEHDHLMVPWNDGVDQHKRLGRWISYQRYLFNHLQLDSNGDKIPNGPLTKERIDKLKSIPGLLFYLSEQDLEEIWEERYQQAADFYQEHGHLQVPWTDRVDWHKHLNIWIKTQRYQFSLLEVDSNGDKIPNGRMTKERIDKLKIIPGLLHSLSGQKQKRPSPSPASSPSPTSVASQSSISGTMQRLWSWSSSFMGRLREGTKYD